jgi:hypothetical protein
MIGLFTHARSFATLLLRKNKFARAFVFEKKEILMSIKIK